ncbi:MAG: hypothetical protein C0467_03735 [Planctomycetaceae bacterium]|nr:hypothetical protein [Planctomycetaceae bacterium]
MMSTLKPRHPLYLLVVWCVLLTAGVVEARVGGGESYSGSRSSSGGSSSGHSGHSSGDVFVILRLIVDLIQLHAHHPRLAIVIDCVLVGLIIFYFNSRDDQAESFSSQSPRREIVSDRQPIHERFDAWRKYDPNFSEHLFFDFVMGLYANAHMARGKRQIAAYSPFLSPEARQSLAKMAPPELAEVSGVIVGALHVIDVALPGPMLRVRMKFEANYVEKTQDGKEHTWYAVEEWSFSRERDLLSKPPGKLQSNNCPNCGAGLELNPNGSCKYCQMVVKAGSLDWGVDAITLVGREQRGPQLTTTVEDVGRDEPTVFQPNLGAARTRFMEINADFALPVFLDRVKHIFRELQKAWSSRQWDLARPYETDAIFQTHRYWIEAYRKQDLRNVLDDVKVEQIKLVRFGKDAFYDSITCRIFASMIDYVEDAKGKVVRGDKKTPTKFSEYWTFIRSRRATQCQQPNQNCPNCGAALKVNMAGECAYCGSKITNGDFDWVLSRIEQDEAYSG